MESILAPLPELVSTPTGKPGGADDSFFANSNGELSDKGFLVAAADNLIAWARTGSLMWMQFGLACCAIEIMQMSMPRYDVERFGRGARHRRRGSGSSPSSASRAQRTRRDRGPGRLLHFGMSYALEPSLFAHNCDALRSNFVEIFSRVSAVEGIMSGQIPRLIGSIALVATLLVSGMGVGAPANIARANACLRAPNSSAPQGSHWYYRLDWASQRRCWYLRAPGQPVQQAAARATLARVTPVHSMRTPSGPISAADGSASIKPTSAQAITAATMDKLVRLSAQEGNAAPSTIEAPAQASTSSQTSVQAAGPAPAAPVTWPDAPPAVATVKAPTDVPPVSVSDNTEKTAPGGKPTDNAGAPIIIFPILALGLAAVGTLSRVVVKIAAERRAPTMINHPEPETVHDQRQHDGRDDQDQHQSVDEPREYHSLKSAVNDYSPFLAEGAHQIAYQISKRRDKLARLHQDLDRLLQHGPRQAHDVAMAGVAG